MNVFSSQNIFFCGGFLHKTLHAGVKLINVYGGRILGNYCVWIIYCLSGHPGAKTPCEIVAVDTAFDESRQWNGGKLLPGRMEEVHACRSPPPAAWIGCSKCARDTPRASCVASVPGLQHADTFVRQPSWVNSSPPHFYVGWQSAGWLPLQTVPRPKSTEEIGMHSSQDNLLSSCYLHIFFSGDFT